MKDIKELTIEQQKEVIELQTRLDNPLLSFLERMDLEDQLMDLKIKYKLITTSSTSFDQIDCIGCGS